MAAMKPRTGDGPLEVTKEGRGIVMRVPLEGGGRLVVEMAATEAGELGGAVKGLAGAGGGRSAPSSIAPAVPARRGPGRFVPGPRRARASVLAGGDAGSEAVGSVARVI